MELTTKQQRLNTVKKRPTGKPANFAEWQAYAKWVNYRAKLLQDSIHDKGWKLAATVEIPHDMCCLHNASIDDNMTGWCAGNPKRLKVAKQANHIVNDWTVSRIAERLVSRAWNHMAKANGYRAID